MSCPGLPQEPHLYCIQDLCPFLNTTGPTIKSECCFYCNVQYTCFCFCWHLPKFSLTVAFILWPAFNNGCTGKPVNSLMSTVRNITWNYILVPIFTSVLLQHNNAQPHSANATITVIHKLNSELLPHPLYSQDLASVVTITCSAIWKRNNMWALIVKLWKKLVQECWKKYYIVCNRHQKPCSICNSVQHCHQYYRNVNTVISDIFLLTSSCSLVRSVKGSMQQNSKFL